MDYFEVVHTQRAIRRFKPDPVPEEDLWKMIDAAIRAPSGSNTQPWAWLVVQDAGKRAAMSLRQRSNIMPFSTLASSLRAKDSTSPTWKSARTA